MSRAKPLAVAMMRALGMAAWMAGISGVAWIAVPRARGYWRRRMLRMFASAGWVGVSLRSRAARAWRAADWVTVAILGGYQPCVGRRLGYAGLVQPIGSGLQPSAFRCMGPRASP